MSLRTTLIFTLLLRLALSGLTKLMRNGRF